MFVECSIIGYAPNSRIDHHNPDDLGYAMGPALYWKASSIGQLHAMLRVPPKESDYVLAAMDHCFNASMKGLCPGISVKDVRERKIAEIAKTTRLETEAVNKMIFRWRNEIESCKGWYEMSGDHVYLVHNDDVVYNLTRENLGFGYSAEYLTAQVAGVESGFPIILKIRDTPNSQPRLHLCGDASPELVAYFMESEKDRGILEKIYGSPDRGYAGGFIIEERVG